MATKEEKEKLSADEQAPAENGQGQDASGGDAQPKALTPVQRKRLEKQFEYGRSNVAKGDLSYATDMFARCVLGDPLTMRYNENLMETLHQKFEKEKKKGAKLGGFKGSGVRAAIKKAKSKEDWSGVVSACVDGLQVGPWDVPTLLAMAEACMQLGSTESQLYYLRQALDVNPKDPDVNRICGKALANIGQYTQAIACWHRVQQAKPDDDEAESEIARLAVERTVPGDKNAGAAQATRDAAAQEQNIKSSSKSSGKEEEDEEKTASTGVLSREEILIKQIKSSPAEVAGYIDLAEYYATEDLPEKALQVTQKGMEVAGGGDPKLRDMLEDFEIRCSRKRVRIAERRAAEDKTPESAELLKRLKKEHNLVELEIFGSKLDRNQNNDAVRYEYGVRLKRAGQFKEAIQNLQKALTGMKRKSLPYLEIGECFQYLKRLSLAMQNYEHAIVEAVEDELETKKLALYRAGVLAMGLYKMESEEKDVAKKHLDSAEKYLTELAGVDFGYLDVAERLDKIADLRNKG